VRCQREPLVGGGAWMCAIACRAARRAGKSGACLPEAAYLAACLPARVPACLPACLPGWLICLADLHGVPYNSHVGLLSLPLSLSVTLGRTICLTPHQ